MRAAQARLRVCESLQKRRMFVERAEINRRGQPVQLRIQRVEQDQPLRPRSPAIRRPSADAKVCSGV